MYHSTTTSTQTIDLFLCFCSRSASSNKPSPFSLSYLQPSESPPPPPDHDADHHGNQGDGHAPVDFTSKKAHPPVKPIPYKTLGGPQEVPRPTPTKEVILPSPDRSSPLRPPKVPEATPSASVSSATVADQSRDHLPSLIQFDDDTKAAPKKGNPPPRPSINPTATVPSSSPDVKHKVCKSSYHGNFFVLWYSIVVKVRHLCV